MSAPQSSHIQASLRVPSRRDTLLVIGIDLVIVWAVVAIPLWPLPRAGAVLLGLGICQMVGWIRPL